jgi:DNA-binding FadR family transcriptional regulator
MTAADTAHQPALDYWLAAYRRHTEAEAAYLALALAEQAAADRLRALIRGAER